MTIGTTGDLFRITEPIVFPVITVHVRPGRHIENIVSLHHLLIAVACQADLGMEYPVGVELRVVYRLDIMEIMAIVTGGGILIACRYRFAVNRLPVNRLLVMTLNALGNDNTFVIFPIAVRVDVGMAIGAFDILLYMHAGIVLSIFFFVAALTPDPLHFYFTLHVPGKVGKLDMAAVTTILTVNGRDKSSGGDFISVAAEASNRIDRHTLLRPQGISGKKNNQDRERHAGKHIQHADPPVKTKKQKQCIIRSPALRAFSES
jgi:hypothetical protein